MTSLCSLLQVALKAFEAEVLTDSCSPLVTCALDMLDIMADVEPLLQ